MILIPGLLQILKRIFWDDDIPVIPERRNLDPNTMEFVVDILERKGEGMKGASEKDLDSVRVLCNGIIPFAYFQFLKYMGRGCDRFMVGSSVFMDEVLELKEGALDLCEDNSIPPVPENAFVFWMHQGYQAFYFIPEEGEDNPYVYYYYEGRNSIGFIKQNFRYIDFLKIELIGLYPDVKDNLYPDGNIPRIDLDPENDIISKIYTP